MITVQFEDNLGEYRLVDQASGKEGPFVPYHEVATLLLDDGTYYATMRDANGDDIEIPEGIDADPPKIAVFRVEDSIPIGEFDVVTAKDAFCIADPEGEAGPSVDYGEASAIQDDSGTVYIATARSRSDVDEVQCVTEVSEVESVSEFVDDPDADEEVVEETEDEGTDDDDQEDGDEEDGE